MLKPDNLSVLSRDGVRGRVNILADLLRTTSSVRLLAMDSKESFLSNKHFYQERLAVYYQRDAVTEQFPNFDGEEAVCDG